jgi:hypothetical protein
MLSIDDIKVLAVNTTSMVMFFANVESVLTIIALLASIVYTIQKIIKQSKQ